MLPAQDDEKRAPEGMPGTMLIIAVVHSDNRLAVAIAIGAFAARVAMSLLPIAAHNHPFTGAIPVRPDPLLRLMPETATGAADERAVIRVDQPDTEVQALRGSLVKQVLGGPVRPPPPKAVLPDWRPRR